MASFLVIGIGRFGYSVATELYRLGHEVMAVDEREESAARIMDSVTSAIVGDAKDEAVLNSIGVQNFDCAVVSMAGTIEESILTTLMLKELGAKKIVCKAQDERHEKILTLIGADKVVRPEYDMGKRVAQSLVWQNVIDYVEISSDFILVEIETPAQWTEKSIMKNNLRRKYGVTVIAIREAGSGKMNFSPNPDVILNRGDVLSVIGTPQNIDDINSIK